MTLQKCDPVALFTREIHAKVLAQDLEHVIRHGHFDGLVIRLVAEQLEQVRADSVNTARKNELTTWSRTRGERERRREREREEEEEEEESHNVCKEREEQTKE